VRRGNRSEVPTLLRRGGGEWSKICRFCTGRERARGLQERRLPSDGARCVEATARGRGGAAGYPLGFLPAAGGVHHERETEERGGEGSSGERRQRARL
jgi:hypothetical protein